MHIEWTEPALADLELIRDFIDQDNPFIAANVAAGIIDSTDRLADFPNSGRPGDEPGTFELVVADLPYVLVYRVTSAQIEILRVWHQRQNRLI